MLIRWGLIFTGLSVAGFFVTLFAMTIEDYTRPTPAEMLANFNPTLDWDGQPPSDPYWRTAIIDAGPYVLCGNMLGFIAGVVVTISGIVWWCIVQIRKGGVM